jgi:Protein of unknown function (DUF4446)
MPTYVAVFALVLAYVALVAAYFALRSLARLRRATAVLSPGTGADGTATHSLAELTQRNAETTALLGEQLGQLRGELRRVSVSGARGGPRSAGVSGTSGSLGNVALVRYDAFSEMSGRMSFSLALLNDNGDGVTISAIAAPTDTRVYAKGISAGKGEQDLSPEERQAVAAALDHVSGRLAQRAAS